MRCRVGLPVRMFFAKPAPTEYIMNKIRSERVFHWILNERSLQSKLEAFAFVVVGDTRFELVTSTV